MTLKKILTAEQVKSQFKNEGKTFTAWAKKRGYRLNDVYRVLNGQLKANYGNAHQIAVDLGMKEGVESSESAQAA